MLQSLVSGTGLDTLIAGIAGAVAVQPRDAWGNPRGDLGDRLWLQYTPLGLSPVRTAMVPDGTGIFRAAFSVQLAGASAVAVAVEYDSPQVRGLLCNNYTADSEYLHCHSLLVWQA